MLFECSAHTERVGCQKKSGEGGEDRERQLTRNHKHAREKRGQRNT